MSGFVSDFDMGFRFMANNFCRRREKEFFYCKAKFIRDKPTGGFNPPTPCT